MAEELEGVGYVKARGVVKTNLSTRPVSFITRPEVEVYQLADVAGSMLYGKHERLKKRLKARQLTYQKVQQVHHLSFKGYLRKISELL